MCSLPCEMETRQRGLCHKRVQPALNDIVEPSHDGPDQAVMSNDIEACALRQRGLCDNEQRVRLAQQ